MPHSMQYYITTATTAFKYVQQNPTSCQNLSDHYLSFLDDMINKAHGQRLEFATEMQLHKSSDNTYSEPVTIEKSIDLVLIVPPYHAKKAEVANLFESFGQDTCEKNNNYKPHSADKK